MTKFDVVVVPDAAVNGADSDAPLTLFSLNHPRTGSEVLYAVSGKEGKELYEVQNIDNDDVIGCWALGEGKIGGGTRLIAVSRTDPLFILLPLLRAHAKTKNNVPLEDLLSNQVSTNMTQYYDHLMPAFQSRLPKVADSIGPPDLKVWKWNEAKTMAYLAKKARRLALKLAQTKIQTDGASSEILIKASSDEDRIKLAWDILSDSLDAEMSAMLKDKLGIRDEAAVLTSPPSMATKKAKTEPPEGDHTSDYSKALQPNQKKEVKLTAKQKALEKGKVGTKSIASFFGKAPTKK